MNKAIPLLIAYAILIPGVTQGEPRDSGVGEVEQVVQQLKQAMLDADGPTLRTLTADGLSYGHSSGKIENKSEFVETLVTGVSVFEEIQLTDQTVDIVDNTSIVRHILTAKTNDRGKGPGTVKLSVLQVWIKNDGQWQLLARQAVKVP